MARYDSPYSYIVRRLSSADTIKQMLFDIPDCSQSHISLDRKARVSVN